MFLSERNRELITNLKDMLKPIYRDKPLEEELPEGLHKNISEAASALRTSLSIELGVR
jgi:hypothetical protein